MMKSESVERDWIKEVGGPAYASIVEMVDSLECDYDRLEELRNERDELTVAMDDAVADEAHSSDRETEKAMLDARASLDEWNADNAEELAELSSAAGECEDRESAEDRIREDPLTIRVRSGWVDIGGEMEPEEFEILLSTGGPAVRIIGELDGNREPCRARLEVQDWFKPWSEYLPANSDVLLTYCRVFCFE